MADIQQNDTTVTERDATASIAQALSEFLEHPTYACGGTIKASTETAPSVTIRWDSTDSIEKLTFPLPSNASGEANSPLGKLLQHTQPAGFGYQGKDIIDESYRKASKLDTSA